MDCSLPGFSVHEFLQARLLGWIAMSFSKISDNYAEIKVTLWTSAKVVLAPRHRDPQANLRNEHKVSRLTFLEF